MIYPSDLIPPTLVISLFLVLNAAYSMHRCKVHKIDLSYVTNLGYFCPFPSVKDKDRPFTTWTKPIMGSFHCLETVNWAIGNHVYGGDRLGDIHKYINML